jgi:hypothetical protein
MPMHAVITPQDTIYKVNDVDDYTVSRHIFSFVCHVLFEGDKSSADCSMYYLWH